MTLLTIGIGFSLGAALASYGISWALYRVLRTEYPTLTWQQFKLFKV